MEEKSQRPKAIWIGLPTLVAAEDEDMTALAKLIAKRKQEGMRVFLTMV
jgi:hypothetical protein